MTHFAVTSTVCNAEKFVGRCVESVRRQTCSDFDHYLIDAASDDQTVYQALKFNHEKLHVRKNSVRKTALENVWEIWQSLPDDEIIIWLDGDDWLATDYALEYLDQVYSNPEIWLTFGQFMWTDGRLGFARPYSNEVIALRSFRRDTWRATHLKTFRAGLVKKIRPEDLRKPDGEWMDLAIDRAIMYPLLEMAGERHFYSDRILYVYNAAASWEVQNPEKINLGHDEVRRLWTMPKYERLTQRPW